jgi:hypothetical protein
MGLIKKTLQRVTLEEGVCTGPELAAMLERVDREDGRADGRAPLSG